jgi:hypothetical protein
VPPKRKKPSHLVNVDVPVTAKMSAPGPSTAPGPATTDGGIAAAVAAAIAAAAPVIAAAVATPPVVPGVPTPAQIASEQKIIQQGFLKNLRHYDGTRNAQKFHTFVKNVTMYCDSLVTITGPEKCQIFLDNLEGNAADWANTVRVTAMAVNPGDVDWSNIRTEFAKQFFPQGLHNSALTKMSTAALGGSLQDLNNIFISARTDIHLSHTYLGDDDISETELIRYYKFAIARNRTIGPQLMGQLATWEVAIANNGQKTLKALMAFMTRAWTSLGLIDSQDMKPPTRGGQSAVGGSAGGHRGRSHVGGGPSYRGNLYQAGRFEGARYSPYGGSSGYGGDYRQVAGPSNTADGSPSRPCFHCGSLEHWARECPSIRGNAVPGGAPTRGRFNGLQGGRGRQPGIRGRSSGRGAFGPRGIGRAPYQAQIQEATVEMGSGMEGSDARSIYDDYEVDVNEASCMEDEQTASIYDNGYEMQDFPGFQ